MENYKDNENYKAILDMGYIDITSQTRSRPGTIVFQHKREIERDVKKGDMRYVLQQSGYVRGARVILRPNKKPSYNYNGGIIDKFQQGDIPAGLLLLKIKLEVKEDITKRADTYEKRVVIKGRAIINMIFDSPRYNSFIHYLQTGKAFNSEIEKYDKILEQLDDPKKKYQAIIRMAKELGV